MFWNKLIEYFIFSAATNMLLTHAKIYRNYQKNYKETQNGLIGITNGGRFCLPASDSPADLDVSQTIDFLTLMICRHVIERWIGSSIIQLNQF